MKAVICTKYGPPDVLELREVDKPCPKNKEILIKVIAASVTTADTMMRRGTPYIGRLFLGIRKPKHPVTGTGFSGVVEAIGKDVTRFKAGDQLFGESVFGHGSNAEYTCVAQDGVLAKLPQSMSHESAASVCDGALTSLSFLKDIGKIQPGQQVLINGASGSLGSAAVQIAKHFGAYVTGVCGSDNIELVESLGADEVIDYRHVDFAQEAQQYDIIYDAVGKRSFYECKKVLSKNGRYLSPVLSFTLLLSMFWTSVFGDRKALFSATGVRPAKELLPLLDELKKLYTSKVIRTVIERKYTLDQVVSAHRHIGNEHKKGNVVINVCS